MNVRQFAPDRRSYGTGMGDRNDDDGLPSMSIYGTSPDSAPAMAWLQRQRSESDMDERAKQRDLEEKKELKRRQQMRFRSLSSSQKTAAEGNKTNGGSSKGSSESPQQTGNPSSSSDAVTTTASTLSSSSARHEEESKGSIEVVSDTVVSYAGFARMAPSWVQTVQDTSPVERMEKCNSCDDLLKVFNGSTNSWDLLRGADLRSWETVSNK